MSSCQSVVIVVECFIAECATISFSFVIGVFLFAIGIDELIGDRFGDIEVTSHFWDIIFDFWEAFLAEIKIFVFG